MNSAAFVPWATQRREYNQPVAMLNQEVVFSNKRSFLKGTDILASAFAYWLLWLPVTIGSMSLRATTKLPPAHTIPWYRKDRLLS